MSGIDCYWCHLTIDDSTIVRSANDQASSMLEPNPLIGAQLTEVASWFRLKWLKNVPVSRLIKTTISEKILLDVIPCQENQGWFDIYFRHLNDFIDRIHLWCEDINGVISLQKFIDTSCDGIVVSNGEGTILTANSAFFNISDLSREMVVGKSTEQLLNDGIIPCPSLTQAVKKHEVFSSVMKFTNGKEAVVSSTPLTDKTGKVIRVISNVRDISELNSLHEKLRNAKDLATGFQRELKAITLKSSLQQGLIRSRIMEQLYELVRKVADTDLTLLITGESGVGKTALAKFIHSINERQAKGNFIHINCSALPETLLESELFGYEEGSFTGARKSKVGMFELANNGTLFLDEIGDMPLSLQAKLLNVLQEGKFYRVGGTKEISVDVRIITATNTKLHELINKGQFRQDLFYRLNVIPIRIPSLAERKEDIPPLINYYLAKSNQRYKKKKTLSPEALDIMLRYDWPGNIRELINLIERMVVIVDAPIIELRHIMEVADNSDLANHIHTSRKLSNLKDEYTLLKSGLSLKEIVAEIEEEIIEEAVAKSGSLKAASEILKVNITTLIRKRGKRLNNAI